MELTYLGTAMLRLELAGLRLVTDPALDPAGTSYDFGPWYAPRAWFRSEKTYDTPTTADAIGAVDAVLLSHDHHADNLDHAGRRFLASGAVARVITTTAGARRLARTAPRGESQPGAGLGLGERAHPLAWGASTTVGGLTITATPARHGPAGTPRIDEVIGFLIEAPGQPTIWISGDTVLHPRVHAFLDARRASGKRIDVAIIHCGAVAFPRLPVLGKQLFTFDATQAIEACKLIDPGLIVPIHRDGWTHFRQPDAELRAAFAAAGLGERTRFLALGETLAI